MAKQLQKYYDIEPLWSKNYTYAMAIGMRSNGKTYAALKKCLELYAQTGDQFAVIRTWADDFKGKGGVTLFDPLINNGVIDDLFNGEYTTVIYKSERWYLASFDDKGKAVLAPEPFAWAFPLTTYIHDKGSSYPKIKNVIYDEFMIDGYLPEGIVDTFFNCLSTIIRDKDDVKIIMIANTVNIYSPFFDAFGIDARKLVQGEIAEYRYADNPHLVVGVEFCDPVYRTEKQNKYFAFGRSSTSDMITTGKWQLPHYPRPPIKYVPKDVKFCCFVKYKELIIQIDVIRGPYYFIAIAHKKSGEIKNPERDIIYDSTYEGLQRNIIKNIYTSDTEFSRRLLLLKLEHKFYYSDNIVGESIRNWLHESKALIKK